MRPFLRSPGARRWGTPPGDGIGGGIAVSGQAQKWVGAKFTLARTIAGPHNACMASPKSKMAPTKPRTRFDAVETKDGQWLVRLNASRWRATRDRRLQDASRGAKVDQGNPLCGSRCTRAASTPEAHRAGRARGGCARALGCRRIALALPRRRRRKPRRRGLGPATARAFRPLALTPRSGVRERRGVCPRHEQAVPHRRSPSSRPPHRPRRNRKAEWARRLIREQVLTTDDLIWPLFLIEGEKARTSGRGDAGRRPAQRRPGGARGRARREARHSGDRLLPLHRAASEGRTRQRGLQRGQSRLPRLPRDQEGVPGARPRHRRRARPLHQPRPRRAGPRARRRLASSTTNRSPRSFASRSTRRAPAPTSSRPPT